MRVRAKAIAPQEKTVRRKMAAVSVLRCFSFLVLVLAMAPVSALPVFGNERYITNDAERLGPPPDEAARPPKHQQPGSRVIFRSEAVLDENWILNAEMSRRCREGHFKQRADRRYVALLGPDTYGAAVGGHGSLIDRVGLSKPEVLYIFRGQGTTYCRVYHRSRG